VKVLHIVTAFPRHEEDVITPWLGRLLVGLRDAGAAVSVLAPAYRGGGAASWCGIPVRRFRYAPAFLETLTHDETVPDRLRSQPAYAALLPGYFLGGTVSAAIAAAEADAPDIVHVHWPVPHAWFGAVARTVSGGRTALVSSFYSVEIRWIERQLPWAVPLLRWAIETSDALTAISTATADAVRRYSIRDVAVIPFSASLSAPAAATLAGDPHPGRAPAPPDALRILFVGRLVERKGVPILLEALRLVRQSAPASLTVVGDGPLRAHLERQAGDLGGAVDFRGRVTADELAALYAASDVFVLPAVVDAKGDTEGLGVVLLEALEFELPVIASRVGGIPDIIEDGTTGWLVPPADARSLARKILAVMDRPDEARRVARHGRVRSRERFGLTRVVDDLLDAYARAISDRRAGAMGDRTSESSRRPSGGSRRT